MKPDGETPYELNDFVIGNEISINSRVFRVVDADGYTRKFLSATMGITLGNAESYPIDPFQAMVTKLNSPRPSPRKKKVDTLKMFLENDRKVLRFYAQWDDSGNLFGEKSE